MAATLRPVLLRQSCQSLKVGRLSPKVTRYFHSGPAVFSTQSLLGTSHVRSILPCPYPTVRKPSQTRLSQTAHFHTTDRRSILPAGPQVIEGTANDAAPIPEASPTHGSYHWAFERLISAALIPLTIAPFAAGTLNPITDAILCATIIIHSHIGFQSIIIDYIPLRRLPRVRALFWWGLRVASLTVAVGLYEFETNDVGLTEAVKRIWTA